ncbi:hypothetical protein WR25_26619 [Diploscapter pachys]|uniref:mitogen-activated protein kinase n=1 Tax=Diploscapter pachys TaxID=2018661 RepID=A0A2A2LC05_9BILA|nr:hypothetical protein WR25_26619 [Diploscapter pachys]
MTSSGVFFANFGPPPPETSVPDGFHATELNKSRWVVPQVYQRLRSLAEGAYGQVCTAEYTSTGERVAIKKFFRPFQSTIHAKRTYRELKLLRSLIHDNVLEMVDAFTPDPNVQSLNNVYFVSPLMGSDLQAILKIQRLTDEQMQLLVYQILRGLKYVHSANIIHRDLKPSNIAINERCEVKILDFGLARQTDSEMTGYVATRWYRAPEIMLNWMHYSQTVDIWSVGCILAELVSGRPLFPGDDHIDQLTRIMAVVGTPDEQFIMKIQSEEARNYIRNLPPMPRKNFTQLFPSASRDALDLLDKMLVLDPDQRISVENSLRHNYLREYRSPNDEPVAAHPVVFEPDEESATSLDDWRELIWRELILFQNSGRRISYSIEGTITGEDETEDIEEVDEENEDDMIYEDVPSSHQ